MERRFFENDKEMADENLHFKILKDMEKYIIRYSNKKDLLNYSKRYKILNKISGIEAKISKTIRKNIYEKRE